MYGKKLPGLALLKLDVLGRLSEDFVTMRMVLLRSCRMVGYRKNEAKEYLAFLAKKWSRWVKKFE